MSNVTVTQALLMAGAAQADEYDQVRAEGGWEDYGFLLALEPYANMIDQAYQGQDDLPDCNRLTRCMGKMLVHRMQRHGQVPVEDARDWVYRYFEAHAKTVRVVA